jgi:uncharacterized membrane protein
MKIPFLEESFDPMIDDATQYRWGIFYFNRKDKRVVVPKRYRFLGFTVNFARPGAYFIIFALLALMTFAMFMARLQK